MAAGKSVRKGAVRRATPRTAGAAVRKKAVRKKAVRRTASRAKVSRTRPVLLSGGNPQVAKADGDAPVGVYLAALSGWKRDLARRIDALVTRTAPSARKAVKWNSPFYGIEGRGWFLAFHVFTRALKVTFFRGTSLLPVPPGGMGKETRWIDVHEDDLDELQMTKWIRQAAAIPGWDGSSRSGSSS